MTCSFANCAPSCAETGYEVGAQDRDEWIATAHFGTEEEACAYAHDLLTRRGEQVASDGPERGRHARRVSSEVDAELRRRFGAD